MKPLIKGIYRWLPIIIAIILSLTLIKMAHGHRLDNCILGKEDNLLTTIGGIIAFSMGIIWKIREETRIEKNLFDTFNNRYDTRFNDHLNNFRKKENDLNKAKGTNEDRVGLTLAENEENLVIDYLNMCAEEYLWYKKGLISEDIWRAWLNGMKSNVYGIICVKKIWETEKETTNTKESYYGLDKVLTPL